LTNLEPFEKSRIVAEELGRSRRRTRRRTFVVLRPDAGDEGEPVVLEDDAAVQAFGDPLRVRLLKLLAEPTSAKDLADQVDRPVTSLYHHLDLLERHGLISVADLRKEGRVVIRRYQRTADRFETGGDVHLAVAVDRAARQPVRRVMLRGPMDRARVDELVEQLTATVEGALGAGEGADRTWEIEITIRPVLAEDANERGAT
jgi:DNA-binding transcriptional ArsR family regulator